MAITKIRQRQCPINGTREVTVTSYVGRVLAVYNRDYRAMSDVYTLATFALVLNEKDELREVLVNANFECDQSQGRATVDATPEVLAIKERKDAEQEKLCKERQEADQRARAEAELHRPVRGKRMVVARGRKVPIGFSGTVAFISSSGNVLLKADHQWQDRNAQGTWVSAQNLRAIV